MTRAQNCVGFVWIWSFLQHKRYCLASEFLISEVGPHLVLLFNVLLVFTQRNYLSEQWFINCNTFRILTKTIFTFILRLENCIKNILYKDRVENYDCCPFRKCRCGPTGLKRTNPCFARAELSNCDFLFKTWPLDWVWGEMVELQQPVWIKGLESANATDCRK